MKKFSLPGYYHHYYEIKTLINYRNQYPEYFYEDRIIDSAYDLPPGLIWNGGRINLRDERDVPKQKLFEYYHHLSNFHLRHTCTNMLLDEKLVQDVDCNKFIKQYISSQDYIIINNKILYSYLKENYPTLQFIWSTTLGITELNQVNDMSKNNIFVMNYNYNNDNEYISKLINPQNIEVLCAEPCIDNCPDRMRHYRSLSKQQLHLTLDNNDIIYCPNRMVINQRITPQKEFDTIQSRHHAITSERIDELASQGIQYFKISGRFIKSNVFYWIITYYLVLPEYREKVYNELLMQATVSMLKDRIK